MGVGWIELYIAVLYRGRVEKKPQKKQKNLSWSVPLSATGGVARRVVVYWTCTQARAFY